MYTNSTTAPMSMPVTTTSSADNKANDAQNFFMFFLTIKGHMQKLCERSGKTEVRSRKMVWSMEFKS